MKPLIFTVEEANTILDALRIAAEDGSIYPEDAAEFAHVDAVIESIRKKVRLAAR